jgi:ABC-2 type transport system permease protein
MKNKALFESLCVVLIIVVMLGGGVLMPAGENMSFDMQAMESMANELLGMINKIYPPTAWFAGAYGVGSSTGFLIGIIASTALLGIVVLLTVTNFESINRRLHTSIAKHDYKLGKLEKKSMMKAIIYREAKGYFSSGTYVMNTIIGSVMAVVFSISLFFIDLESVFKSFPIDINVNAVIPMLFAGILTISNPIAVSVSMEGKEFWIIKSLPVMDRDILKGKLMFSALLLSPFFVVGEIIMIIALKPSISYLPWMIAMPMAIISCTLVMGLAINLKFPKLKWSSDVEVIKQSAAAFIGGFVGVLLALISMIPVLIVPMDYYNIAACGVCIILFIVTIVINSKNNKFDLKIL